MRGLVLLSFLLSACGAAAGAEDCPAAPDIDPQEAPLLDALAHAGGPADAQRLMDGLWRLWTKAPDQAAQDLLDTGMERREVYDFDGALKALDALVAYCPAYAEGWNQRAFVRFLKSDYPEALDDLRKALTLSPHHIGAMSGLAVTLIQMGRGEDGQKALRAALAMNPWLPERGYLLPEKPADPGSNL